MITCRPQKKLTWNLKMGNFGNMRCKPKMCSAFDGVCFQWLSPLPVASAFLRDSCKEDRPILGNKTPTPGTVFSSGMCWILGDLGRVLYVLLAGGMEDYGRIWYLCEFQRHYIMTLTYAHATCVMVPFNYNRGNSQPKVASLMSWEILSNKWEVSSNMSTSAGTLRRIVEINILLPSTNRTPTGSSRPSWVRC